MTRDVECFMLVDGTINGTVGEGNCTEFGLETLENTQVCNDRPCPAYIVPEFGMVCTVNPLDIFIHVCMIVILVYSLF